MTEAPPQNKAVSFQQPLNPQMALQQLAIQQRMAMAQKLMDASQQSGETQMVGGGNGVNQIAVPNSKLGGLAKMLGGAIGTNQYYSAARDAAQMQGQYMQDLMKLANGGGQGGGATGGTPGMTGSGPNWQGIETALTAAGQKDMADMIQKNHPVTPDMANAEASGVANPVALAGAMKGAADRAAIGPQIVNGRPGVMMTGQQALDASGNGGPPSGPAMASAIPGGSAGNTQLPVPPPQSGPQFTDNNVQYAPPMGPPGPAMGPALSAMPNPPAAQAIVNGTPNPPPAADLAAATGQPAPVGPPVPPASPPAGMGAPPVMPPQPTPMVIGGQTPQEKAALDAQAAGQTKFDQDAATSKAEDVKLFRTMKDNLPAVLGRLNDMRNAAPNASYGYGVENDGTGPQQTLQDQLGSATGRANHVLLQKSAQGVLPEIGPMLAQGNVKGNKFLESLSANSSGLDMGASPKAKMDIINGLNDNYVSTLKGTAGRLRDQGVTGVPSDAEIDDMVKQAKGGATQPQFQEGQTATNPKTGQKMTFTNGAWK
jgi:hypothetical protein